MKITISYQPQLLTPPHAYAAVLVIDSNADGLNTQLSIEYLGRDSISTQEITAEGFTENDDYAWEGLLNSSWLPDIESLLSLKRTDEANSDTYLHIAVDKSNDGFPLDIKHAELIFQELLQSILEKDAIENPLMIPIYIDNESYEFTWEFAKRSILEKGKNFKNWEWGRIFMETIFSMNYESITPAKKPKQNSVKFDGQWYPLNKEISRSLAKLIND